MSEPNWIMHPMIQSTNMLVRIIWYLTILCEIGEKLCTWCYGYDSAIFIVSKNTRNPCI